MASCKRPSPLVVLVVATVWTTTCAQRLPLDCVVGLPSSVGSPLRNPFGLTIAKAQPVFDVALEDVARRRLLAPDALRVSYEDTQLSDAIGVQRFVDRYCARAVDAIFGVPYVFALAPISRLSQFWGGERGVPVFTTSAMVDELGDRGAFPLLTRLGGTYKTLGRMVLKMLDSYGWRRRRWHFLFNDQAYSGSQHGRSECFFSLNAVKNVFKSERDVVEWSVEMFSEQTALRERYIEMLKKASFLTNSE